MLDVVEICILVTQSTANSLFMNIIKLKKKNSNLIAKQSNK